MKKRTHKAESLQALQVKEFLLLGMSEKEIASKMFITVQSVKWHKTAVYKAYKVKSQTELMLLKIKELEDQVKFWKSKNFLIHGRGL